MRWSSLRLSTSSRRVRHFEEVLEGWENRPGTVMRTLWQTLKVQPSKLG